MIRFDHVGLRYGSGPEVLRDVSFWLEPNSFHFLTGPSGAGKSSLLQLIYLGHRPTRGQVSLFGRNTTRLGRSQLPALRRRIGVVFQDSRLLPHLTVIENVELPLRVAGVKEKEMRRNATELLRWVGLGDHLEARPPTLSGGQQQRVAIARAIIARPSILLADEPTGNVDETIGLRLIRLFEELNRHGTAVVMATHNDHLISRFPHPRLHLVQGEVAYVPAMLKATA